MRRPSFTFTLLILQNCALPLMEMENSVECIPPSESFNEDPIRVSLKDITNTTNNNKSKESKKKVEGLEKKRWIWDHFETLPTDNGSKGQCKKLNKK
ncbi:hypothetical protein F8M41_002309 [Gigaspora margarita]|uniref:Uncharacterized protein n=1 Tax=Gigaspora margarita TaxID=4874 RepID=A0A8H3XEF1_GIGMA|nr:hypothetical protein F8M41_002309 [Gigaspora margarita]